jgi:flagellar hook-associated protein 2
VTFTGVSQYASDLASVMTRAQKIAQIPITALQNKIGDMATRDISLNSLSSAVANLTQTLTKIGNLSSGGALSASTTDAIAVTATVTGASTPSSYSIENITSIAAAASERTLSGYADTNKTPVASVPAGSTDATVSLMIGGTSYNITLSPSQNNLAGLKAAINAIPNSGVTATIMTAGGTNGNYLAVTANNTGATTLTLTDQDTGKNILTNTNQGTDTKFQLNGVDVDRPGTTINDLIPGVTLNILGKTTPPVMAADGSVTTPGETVGLKVSADSSLVSSALQTLATNYNAVITQVNSQIGPNAGMLSGNNIIYQIRQTMSQLVHFQGSGEINNLANLGISMNLDGTMSFNQATFNGLSDSQITAAYSFLGTSTSGIGGLQKAFSNISDPVSGTIEAQLKADAATTTRLNNQIAILEAQITTSQTTLNRQLETADQSIATLQSVQDMLTSSIQSLTFTSYGYQKQS